MKKDEFYQYALDAFKPAETMLKMVPADSSGCSIARVTAAAAGKAVAERRKLDGQLDWDLAVIAGPGGAVCFALDLAYKPHPSERVFEFGPPRAATFLFPLPAYLRNVAEVSRVEADGVRPVRFTSTGTGIEIAGVSGRENVFVVSPHAGLAAKLEARRRELVAFEYSFGFDPGNRPEDLEELQRLLNP